MHRNLSAPDLIFIIMLLATAGCTMSNSESGQLPVISPHSSLPTDPILAKVGGFDLKLSEVDKLAAMAIEVRQRPPWNLYPTSIKTFEQRMQLAVELLALAWAAYDGAIEKAMVQDSMERALASVYLHRAFLKQAQLPVSEQQLQQAHQDVIRKYLTTGESNLYRPTKVDFAIIGVGTNPSWAKYKKGTVRDILTEQQALDLAVKIKKLCTDEVPDLDRFEALARDFEKHNPTVRIQHHERIAITRGLFPLAPIIRRHLVSLKKNGEISPIIKTPAGFMIMRRGVTWPGKGENLEEIRDELTMKVRENRNVQYLKKITEGLGRKFTIETWPDALSYSPKNEPGK